MPSSYEKKLAGIRVYQKTPGARVKRAANRRKWRAIRKAEAATSKIKTNPAALLSALANWR